MAALASKAVTKVLKGHMSQYAPTDPLYEEITDERTGKKKRNTRKIPDGLSKRDAKILKKIRKRAHYLDKGVMNICGFRVGWTFFIGIVPGLGDAVDAGLNYFMIVKPAKKLDIPKDLLAKMVANNVVSLGLGLVPLVGDIGLAAWKANSRNAHLIEAFLTIRGQEYLATLGQGASTLQPVDGVTSEQLRLAFAPGSGMDGTATVAATGKEAPVKKKGWFTKSKGTAPYEPAIKGNQGSAANAGAAPVASTAQTQTIGNQGNVTATGAAPMAHNAYETRVRGNKGNVVGNEGAV